MIVGGGGIGGYLVIDVRDEMILGCCQFGALVNALVLRQARNVISTKTVSLCHFDSTIASAFYTGKFPSLLSPATMSSAACCLQRAV